MPVGAGFSLQGDMFYLMNLRLTYGFMWEYETKGGTGWSQTDDNDD